MGLKRGYIYWTDFGPPRGKEKSYRRPAVVISINTLNDLLPVVVVVPGTKGANKRRDFPTSVRVSAADSGLPLETVFQAFDVTAVDPTKVEPGEIGKLSGVALTRLEKAVRFTLGLQ